MQYTEAYQERKRNNIHSSMPEVNIKKTDKNIFVEKRLFNIFEQIIDLHRYYK